MDFARICIRAACNLYDFSPKLHAKIREVQNKIHAPCRWGAKRKSTKHNFTEDTAWTLAWLVERIESEISERMVRDRYRYAVCSSQSTGTTVVETIQHQPQRQAVDFSTVFCTLQAARISDGWHPCLHDRLHCERE